MSEVIGALLKRIGTLTHIGSGLRMKLMQALEHRHLHPGDAWVKAMPLPPSRRASS